MDIVIRPISTQSETNMFVRSQHLFYTGDRNFVPPVIAERLKLLDTLRNPFYKHSLIQLFLALIDQRIVGRIAAIINANHNKTHGDRVGFFGFFECINNQTVADALFEAAGSWLADRGIDTVRGPANPSMNDEVGLLIDGFDSPPMLMMTYNPEYYMFLIERAGFEKAKDLYAYKVTHESGSTDKVMRMQQAIRGRHKVTIREMNIRNKTQFLEDVKVMKYVYNAAWVPNWGFVKWTDEEFDFIAADLKQFAEPKLSLIAESDGRAAGFAIAIPDINQCLIHSKSGSIIGAIWHILTKRKKIDQMRIIALGIVPEYQKSGIDAVLYYEISERGHSLGMKFGEASWVLEDNTMMNRGLTLTMNASVYKKYRMYDKKL